MLTHYAIFTSYYAMRKKMDGDFYSVSISLQCPDPRMIQLKDVAPNEYALRILKDNRNPIQAQEQFTNMYKRKLEEMYETGKLKQIADMLIKLANEKPVVLFCFETPETFCHRHIFAEAMSYYFKMNITEYIGYTPPKTPKSQNTQPKQKNQEEAQQLSLF